MSEGLSAIIVGCGAIAGGHDEVSESGGIFTHAGAYRAHPKFAVVACVDPDEARRRAFMGRWGVPAGYSSLDALIESGLNFQVASVCSPTVSHASALSRLLSCGVRAVFCEKPLTEHLSDALRLVQDFETAGIPLAVGYLRRWDPAMTALRDEIRDGRWGRVQLVTGHYNKGVLHIGSHMVDLIQYLLGALDLQQVMHRRATGPAADPTVDAKLSTTDGTPVYLLGCGGARFARFDLAITCDEGLIVIEDSGFQVRRRRAGPHRHFPKVMHLTDGEAAATGLPRAMLNVVDNLHAAVTRGDALNSNGRNAIAAQRLCDAMARASEGAMVGAQ